MTTVKNAPFTGVNEDPMPLDSDIPAAGTENQDQQDGVRVAEAVTASWSKKSLIITYASMWMLYFVNRLNNNLTSNLSAYITSDFSKHSLLTVISVVTSVMGAACVMPIAKVLNLWDRTLGISIMVLIAIMGLIMVAGCHNITTYCAAQELAKRKADKDGQLQYKPRSTRTWWQSVWFYIIEFDIIGIFLMIGGLILFLPSVNIAGNTKGEWKSAKIIAMMVVGFCVLAVFVAYERWGAPKPFIRFSLLSNRTVIGACLLDITYQVSYYCWASYFTSFLQVVFNTSLTQAGYISAIFDLMDPIWLIGCGYLIRVTGRFKWLLMFAVPLYLLASGLMIYFRAPGHSVGYMCTCQIILAVGGGTMILIEQAAVLAAAKNEDYASMPALLSVFGNVGGAVGSSVSGAIWTNTLPKKLRELLPTETKDQWADIYESLDAQLSYPVGSPTRTAIQNAYAFSQRNMMIAGTAVVGLSIDWVLMMRNIKVKDNKNVTQVLF
ncbi:hypothetical protein ANOM_001078 [Aspergillus nomiae NRRL 13137]|uniref:Siderophore iron transporter mirB n=1 Tax=Aspergillus nomiae NRRL (strain ATCC 15546 / NRRL 13137 / CBS 260.88 / M93) TaxID=1509407 RepID=A0A0L1JG13_ASPN3|nr:uncharacterized protein ANOM_001078 [Aspergillus nomiae NRRL 13137]KNG90704.1 hypothetical protein ANOM_001078 [Aspergillus nomiae NRRL 13137]